MVVGRLLYELVGIPAYVLCFHVAISKDSPLFNDTEKTICCLLTHAKGSFIHLIAQDPMTP